MSLSAEQIHWLEQIEPVYKYDGPELRDKSLSALGAPTGAGKSKLISKIIELATPEDEVGETNTMTPRKRRPDDPTDYLTADEGITNEKMFKLIENESLVNWSLFATGDIYGTLPKSYPARHNLLPTMVDAIPMLSRAAFKSIHIIYVVRPLEDWKQPLAARTADAKQIKRLIEAKRSLEFARNSHGIIRVVNHMDNELLQRTARSLLTIVTTDHRNYQSGTLDDYHEAEFETHRRDMENYVDELLQNAGIEV